MSILFHKELSYEIVGIAYEIDNAVGFGQTEKVYSDCFEELLKNKKMNYKRELYHPIKIGEKVVAKRYFDFLVEDKLVVELKTGDYQYKQSCSQLFSYLKASNLDLGLIIRFTKNGVKIKRIPNIRH